MKWKYRWFLVNFYSNANIDYVFKLYSYCENIQFYMTSK
jgi:hypothetical protein